MSNGVAAVPIKGIVNADCTEDGTAIVFQLRSEGGALETLACPIGPTVQIVAALTAAIQKGRKRHKEGGKPVPGTTQLVNALTNPLTAVSFEFGAVILSLFPLNSLALHLALSPTDSRKLSLQLSDAAAKAEDRPRPN